MRKFGFPFLSLSFLRKSLATYLIRVFPLLLFLIFSGCTKKSTKPPNGWEINYPVICDAPAWSPDGSTIAYVYPGILKVYQSGRMVIDLSLSGIWFISPDGTNKRMFLHGGGWPDWSPDGNNKNFLEAAKYGMWPDWSPDMLHFLFVLVEICVADTNGTNAKQLTFLGGDSRDPHWSPHGSKIVFSCQREVPNRLPQIWVMNSDGTNLKQLTTEGGAAPCWSPDGTKIAFVRRNWLEYSPKQGQIWIMDADGNNKRQLTFEGW